MHVYGLGKDRIHRDMEGSKFSNSLFHRSSAHSYHNQTNSDDRQNAFGVAINHFPLRKLGHCYRSPTLNGAADQWQAVGRFGYWLPASTPAHWHGWRWMIKFVAVMQAHRGS